MNRTTDTHTGKVFRYNTTAAYRMPDGSLVTVPARCTLRDFIYLHPSRVPAPLLEQLNADRKAAA